MNDNAIAWVDALRSGGYAQGIGSLKFDGKFCCLGVACDLFMKSEGRGVWDRRDNERASWFQVLDENGEVTVGDSSDVFLPEEVKEWLGLSNAEGKFVAGQIEGYEEDECIGNDSLIDLNDNDSSFDEIANVIEQEPEGLFSS